MPIDNTQAALRAALHAVAPQLQLKRSALPSIEARLLNAGVGLDSTGAVAMTAQGFGGRDITEFLSEVVTKTNPDFFEPGNAKVALAQDLSDMSATQKLGYINGDRGPRL